MAWRQTHCGFMSERVYPKAFRNVETLWGWMVENPPDPFPSMKKRKMGEGGVAAKR